MKAHSAALVTGALLFSAVLTGCPVPASHLATWPGYPVLQDPSNFQHWLILKCAFKDDPTARVLPTGLNPAIDSLDTYINVFLTLGGVGTGNLIDYYRDVTYGSLQLQTRVYGWYTAPFASNNTLGRTQRVEQCASAVPASAGIDFSQWDGILIVTNKAQDGGAAYDGKRSLSINGHSYNLGAVVFDPLSMYTGFAAHEMGHGFGMPHSWDNSSCEYCDNFDIMSAFNTAQFFWANYPPYGGETGHGPGPFSGGAGPGPSVPNLMFLGALPSSRVATFTIGSRPVSYTLTALSHPAGSDPLAVKIVNPSSPSDLYTVEYRQGDGWDQGLQLNIVSIHEYRQGSDPYSYLQEGPVNPNGGNSGGWGAGETYTNRTAQVEVSVNSIDPTSGTATVTVSTP